MKTQGVPARPPSGTARSARTCQLSSLTNSRLLVGAAAAAHRIDHRRQAEPAQSWGAASSPMHRLVTDGRSFGDHGVGRDGRQHLRRQRRAATREVEDQPVGPARVARRAVHQGRQRRAGAEHPVERPPPRRARALLIERFGRRFAREKCAQFTQGDAGGPSQLGNQPAGGQFAAPSSATPGLAGGGTRRSMAAASVKTSSRFEGDPPFASPDHGEGRNKGSASSSGRESSACSASSDITSRAEKRRTARACWPGGRSGFDR